MRTKQICVLIRISNMGEVGNLVPPNMSKPASNFLTGRSKAVLFCGSILLFVFCLCHTVLSVSCSLVVTCWERPDLLTRLYVIFFSCDLWCSESGAILDCIGS